MSDDIAQVLVVQVTRDVQREVGEHLVHLWGESQSAEAPCWCNWGGGGGGAQAFECHGDPDPGKDTRPVTFGLSCLLSVSLPLLPHPHV